LNFISFGSSPLHILPKFFLWVTTRATQIIIENILNNTDGVLKNSKRKTGKAIPAIIDEIDTIPVINNTTRKTPIQHIVSNGCNARNTPKTVATPFPPLNPANRGNIWPIIAIIPAII
jgi:hypothetical protein